MPSLERFFNPQMRVFDLNVKSLPGARLYFFEPNSSTPKITYADKNGETANTNPVIASPSGSFPPIFLDGLYRVELRSKGNITQVGWPIDNVGQDTPIVPYSNWFETITYAQFERVTDPLTGIAYRSKIPDNLGNAPASSPTEWEVIADTVPESFTSSADYFTWGSNAGKVSLEVNLEEMAEAIAEEIFSEYSETITAFRGTALGSSTSTFYLDSDLTLNPLPAGWYDVEVYMQYDTGGSDINGMAAEIVQTDGNSFGFSTSGVWSYSQSSGNPVENTVVFNNTAILAYPISGGNNNTLLFKGMINNTGATGMIVKWAQGTQVPSNAVTLKSAYIKATKLKS